LLNLAVLLTRRDKKKKLTGILEVTVACYWNKYTTSEDKTRKDCLNLLRPDIFWQHRKHSRSPEIKKARLKLVNILSRLKK
jgi:hypothetical protein